MEYLGVKKESNKEIFRLIKPYFLEKLGEYTHQRISQDWHFHGLGFVKDEMTYVFGINIGFFRIDSPEHFSHLGMNILVRRNGLNSELREKYYQFFKTHLAGWSVQPEANYKSDRGGEGAQFPRYKKINDFKSEEEILTFLRESVDFIYEKIYPRIWDNPENLFEGIDVASPPWETTLLELVDMKLGRNKYSGRI